MQTGWKACSTVLQNFLWPTCRSQMTSASCPTILITCRPCQTNYEGAHGESLSLSIHKSLRWFGQLSHQQSAPSLLWRRAAPLHRLLQISGHGLWQTYQWMNSAVIIIIIQHYVHSQLVLSASNSSYGNMTLLTCYTSTCGSLECTQFLLVWMQALWQGKEMDNPLKKWLLTVPKSLYSPTGSGQQCGYTML